LRVVHDGHDVTPTGEQQRRLLGTAVEKRHVEGVRSFRFAGGVRTAIRSPDRPHER